MVLLNEKNKNILQIISGHINYDIVMWNDLFYDVFLFCFA